VDCEGVACIEIVRPRRKLYRTFKTSGFRRAVLLAVAYRRYVTVSSAPQVRADEAEGESSAEFGVRTQLRNCKSARARKGVKCVKSRE
jgi:hypothetical protein